ncbi:MAG TPA: HD domain-containing protein [Armatimonadota bacterium]|jgi:hypothetical protein
MAKTVTLRDAVHGDIRLTAEEASLVDTPEFQRLRGIRQLGAAFLVYPTAAHSRFEHSLGVCHLMARLVEAVNSHSESDQRLSPEEARVLRLAALVHDVTHVPFGHTFEDERRLFPRHDEGPRAAHFLLGPGSELASRLAATGVADQVAALLLPQGEPTDGYLGDFTSGALGADLLDYIKRDLLFTGFRQDFDERIFQSYMLRGGRVALNLTKRGILRDDALSEVMNLLRLRYQLTERVYFHHAKVSAGAMVSKAVECASGLREEDLLGLTDYELLHELRTTFGTTVSRRMVEGLLSRRLYKRAYLISYTSAATRGIQEMLVSEYHQSAVRRAETEAALERAAGLPEGAVLIYCPSLRMSFKEASVPVSLPGHPLIALNASEAVHPARLELYALQERYRQLWRFTVLLSPEHLDRQPALAAACAERFGTPSDLMVGSA